MFTINEDRSIYVTRGDVAFFSVSAEENGKTYKFQPGDVVRIKVMEKKACENVVLEKAYRLESETDTVCIYLTADETRIGEVISKPVDYWYEIELNPFTNPQTIIGYDDNGPKTFRLLPEGGNTTPEEGEGDVSGDGNEITLYGELTKIRIELEDIRKGYDGTIYDSAGESVRKQIENVKDYAKTNIQAANRTLVYHAELIDIMNDKIATLERKMEELTSGNEVAY